MTENTPPSAPLRSVHSANFPGLLTQLNCSLVVSTYQAGKLVLVRAEPDRLNTHFRILRRPMGVAVSGARLAVCTASEIWEFHDKPAVARQLHPVGRHDACYLPRVGHVTGDLMAHEMAWAGDELWFVNTRFSCLSTRSTEASFTVKWRPPFVSALAPDDRCHLNGLGMREGRVRYATALGETDAAKGWRANKRDGGILLDVATNEVLLRGLSMPHSPRWHLDRLWLLESGTGGVGYLDPQSGRYQPIASLPGFTRGLDFAGPLAFVGLSQVRETAVFSGIPVAERPQDERVCGVWVVDLRTGKAVAMLKFEDAVQEIFAVQVLPGRRFPELFTRESDIAKQAIVMPP